MSIMNIIAWIIVGGVAGWGAGYVMKSKAGLVRNVIVGIVGAFIGGFVLNLIGVGVSGTGLNIGSIVTAFIGAVILLGALKFLRR